MRGPGCPKIGSQVWPLLASATILIPGQVPSSLTALPATRILTAPRFLLIDDLWDAAPPVPHVVLHDSLPSLFARCPIALRAGGDLLSDHRLPGQLFPSTIW